ncbi:MAG TPA: radical SAM protein [Planctomycetota bacterium]|nr:radical SAM protein [Planctomycetota bacterium]
MELPRRSRGDELLKPGEFSALRERLRRLAGVHDVATVVACAFDHRTRLLPFAGPDLRMAPAGVRSIGAAMADCGFEKTRIVLQQWNRNFVPAEMKLDGRVPDLFLVSSMSLHATRERELAASAASIPEPHRPLVVVGGARSVYQAWGAFRTGPEQPEGADAAVTGEEFVWLSLLEVLLNERKPGEPLRHAFLRARDRGLLEGIPGLVYARGDGVAEELVDTGTQRLLGDLDELPSAVLGYRLLEPPGRGRTLAPRALPADRVGRFSPISSLVLTFGCKFRCPYCPIPAYNQRQNRRKSPARIVEELGAIDREYGIHYFFGTDDNFFDDHARTVEIAEGISRAMTDGRLPSRKRIRWGTEATVHDTLQLKEHIPLIRSAGLRAIWMGVEDLTATFVKKGQSVDRTTEAFGLLRRHGIHPMPMMMHHDGQPLYTPGKPYGLLNQAQILRDAGAVSFQVLMMTPATGSKLYEEAFTKELAFRSVGGREVEPHMTDANYVIASGEAKPWKKQLNLLLAYAFFYNPLRFLKALAFPKSRLYLADALAQLHGMWGLTKTIRRTVPWLLRLMGGRIVRFTEPPASPVPVRRLGGCAPAAADGRGRGGGKAHEEAEALRSAP